MTTQGIALTLGLLLLSSGFSTAHAAKAPQTGRRSGTRAQLNPRVKVNPQAGIVPQQHAAAAAPATAAHASAAAPAKGEEAAPPKKGFPYIRALALTAVVAAGAHYLGVLPLPHSGSTRVGNPITVVHHTGSSSSATQQPMQPHLPGHVKLPHKAH
jgi:hypothetical protein